MNIYNCENIIKRKMKYHRHQKHIHRIIYASFSRTYTVVLDIFIPGEVRGIIIFNPATHGIKPKGVSKFFPVIFLFFQLP